MTLRFTLTLTTHDDAVEGGAGVGREVATLERGALAPETVGLTLAEAKAILTALQAAIVADQVGAHEAGTRRCEACGAERKLKDRRPLVCRTAFGTARLRPARWRRCACGHDPAAGDRTAFCPLAALLPERITPELLYLETRWGSLVSYGLAAKMLGDVLPLADPSRRSGSGGTSTRSPDARRRRSRPRRRGCGRAASAISTRCRCLMARPTSALMAGSCATAPALGSR